MALEVMGKVDALDGLLKKATAEQVALPDGRVFEDRDHVDKVRAMQAHAVLLPEPELLSAYSAARLAGDDAACALSSQSRRSGVLQ